MKGPHFLYSLGILVGVGILAYLLGFATDPVSMREQVPVETTRFVRSVKKTCRCCKKTMDRVRKQIQQAGERKRALEEKETAAPPATTDDSLGSIESP